LGFLCCFAVAPVQAADHADVIRYQRGLAELKRVDGAAGERVIEQMNAVSPDLGRYIVEYAFGEVYARPGLDLQAKELSVVAALRAMGTAEPQLKVHLLAALHVGCSVGEIQEAILQMSLYSGFPGAINGMTALRGVLNETGAMPGGGSAAGAAVPPADRLKTGESLLARVDPKQSANLQNTFGTLAPDLPRYIIEFGYGDVLARPGLSLARRELITIAALTARGSAPAQLRFHIKGGLRAGLSADEIREVIILMSVYAGFPAAINAMTGLRDVLAEPS
jgi:4-carboxymuconolactone decarboxylase